jgi:hypothetical protein
VLICDERRRQELIQQRERLLALEAGHERKIEAAIPAPLPAQETQSNASAGTGNGIVAQNQSPVAQPDPVFQHFQSIGKAETWVGGRDSDQADPIRADAFPEYDI